MIDPKVWTALLLTMMGAMGTSLGAFMVVLHPKMKFSRLGIFQGLAGGLMLSISVFDLFQESAEAVGSGWANIFFFAGVAFFAAVVYFIPEPDATYLVIDEDDESLSQIQSAKAAPSTADHRAARKELLAADTSPTKRDDGTPRRTSARIRSRTSVTDSAERSSSAQAGQVVSHLIKGVDAGPEKLRSEKAARREAKKRVLLSGLITAIGIALHNFPEGVAVFLGTMKSPTIGISIACAIALHNIPEGVAVALPVYFATGSRWLGFKYAFLSGLAEPAAVVLLGLIFPTNLDKVVVDCLLAAVGGIMAFLALHELLPLAIEHAGREAAVSALFLGMAIMSGNLFLLDNYLTDGHGHA
ncbi:hypothetical protein CEUSTIGMA_g4090.t1 [Chlamydomonas eustigma]|uniref:Uncharacterized protein n=1 Tax=Chlamydomonas eustigma TaxID=1157962 RepID=A0A250X0L7_9CHLO|nr:hypothetical protein CEUSTIGMA_g4090.t1 [Chlamydomonas eustigma]|eukprot:GAX76644.1 hypothetical protein CEUSTIGMA_g4090.t1 [Chlamydomonas eustigma]